MSIKGQNTKSIRKKSLSNTRLPVVGTKNVKVHHEPATVGESYIDLSNLIVPSGTGLVNPSPSEIAKMRLKDFSSNWFLTSNIRPIWMEGLSFEIVSNQTIKLLSTFETLEGEIFTIQYFNHTINGTVIADVRTPQGSGELLEGQTDFNLGEAVPIENLSSQWPMQVFRGTDGRPMLRNASNAPYTGDDSIGNYQMIDRGDGYCQVIRFNIAGDVGNEPVMWASHGALGERPNLSTLQQVDKIHGIMDKMREDLLSVTGNDVADPTRYDNGVPTQSDLKAFGDKVANLEKIFNVEVVSKLSLSTIYVSSIATLGSVLTNGNLQIASNPNLSLIATIGDSVFLIDNNGVDNSTRFIALKNNTYLDLYLNIQYNSANLPVVKDKDANIILKGNKPFASNQETSIAGTVKLNVGEWITFGVDAGGVTIVGQLSFSVSGKVKEKIRDLI